MFMILYNFPVPFRVRGFFYLKHIGRDSWDRPVYEDDEGILWKDVDSRVDRRANLCTSVDNELGERNST